MSDDKRVLIELLRGKGAHTDSIACVSGLTAAQAREAAPLSPHTVWGIVSHMSYWMNYEVQRIRGTPFPYPDHASWSWPTVPPEGSEKEWHATVAEFKGHLGTFEGFAKDRSLWTRELESTHITEKDVAPTVHAVLWQMVAHNSYHLGQVALLRRAMGAWPPPGGSDTW